MEDIWLTYFLGSFLTTSRILVSLIDGDIIGFLIGFFSQTHQDEAYIHAVGIAPEFRGRGIGKLLYQHFYKCVEKKNVKKVRCITSALNTNSIAYHQKLGFTLVEGDKIINGLPVHKNYDGKGNDRVLFLKYL